MKKILWAASIAMLKMTLPARYSIRYEGQLPKPPFVLLPKHQKMLDIILEGLFIYRETRQPANYIMRSFGILDRILALYGGITIVRGRDLRKGGKESGKKVNNEAVIKAIEGLKQGTPLVIHPEGTRRQGEMRDIRIAKDSVLDYIVEEQEYMGQMPFVPAGIEYKGRQAIIRTGNPFYTNSISELEQHLQKEIAKLSNIQG